MSHTPPCYAVRSIAYHFKVERLLYCKVMFIFVLSFNEATKIRCAECEAHGRFWKGNAMAAGMHWRCVSIDGRIEEYRGKNIGNRGVSFY
jgi:hypothetical protein